MHKNFHTTKKNQRNYKPLFSTFTNDKFKTLKIPFQIFFFQKLKKPSFINNFLQMDLSPLSNVETSQAETTSLNSSYFMQESISQQEVKRDSTKFKKACNVSVPRIFFNIFILKNRLCYY